MARTCLGEGGDGFRRHDPELQSVGRMMYSSSQFGNWYYSDLPALLRYCDLSGILRKRGKGGKWNAER